MRNHAADVVRAGLDFRNATSDFAGDRLVGRAGRHDRAGDFLHAGLGNPNFASARGRRALNRADLRANATARIAGIAARDATIDDATRNRVALILPATGRNRNLASNRLRNHRRARNLLLDVFPNDAVDGVLASLLLGDRNHLGVGNLLRNVGPDRLVDRVGPGLLLGDRNHNGVRDFLLALLVNDAIDGVLASLLLDVGNHHRVVHLLRNVDPDGLVDRVGPGLLLDVGNHHRVVHLLRNVDPDGLIDRVGPGLLLDMGNHHRVRDLLLNVVPNDATNRAVHRLLAIFPNDAIDRVANFARLTLRDVLRERALTSNRNALHFGAVASNLLILAHDLAARLHHDVRLRRKGLRARSATGVRARAAIRGLRLFQRKRREHSDRRKRRPKKLFHLILQ